MLHWYLSEDAIVERSECLGYFFVKYSYLLEFCYRFESQIFLNINFKAQSNKCIIAAIMSSFSKKKKYNVRTSLNLRTGYLLNNPRFSDARFIVGRERRVIHANRYPLIKASEVFSRMFEESLNPAGSIKVKDIKPKIFLEMLRFIYYGSPNIKNCNVRGLLYAAEKYQLSVLRKLCEMVIASSASST